LIDGDALRQAEQRRADEAAVLEIGLQRVVLRLVDENAREIAPHEVGEIERGAALEILGGRALHVRRDPIRVEQRTERRRADDLDLLFYRLALLLRTQRLRDEYG